MMAAGLQRDVKRGAARSSTRAPKRFRLRVRPPTRLRPTPANDNRHAILVAYKGGAHGRIGPRVAKRAATKRKRNFHKVLVGRTGAVILSRIEARHLECMAARLQQAFHSEYGTRRELQAAICIT